ncbi:hypothetical protein PSCICN_46790 [Pseudomonas cichorii]|uniref:hypothetical protein n=1 Tax=Pseudomonas cichorii TaxID=36746 RepID=UPI001910363D|nr:hypothetical protein [Pseudomonas cichorii]GFM83987.1 hypothetical protein PSCICN_46790 [Pseudomonas cichorii]
MQTADMTPIKAINSTLDSSEPILIKGRIPTPQAAQIKKKHIILDVNNMYGILLEF